MIRRASAADIDAIARHRVDLFREMAEPGQPALEPFFSSSRTALREGMAEGSCLAWIAEGGVVIGSAVMHLVTRLPSPKSPTGREGYVVHVFVIATHRNRGAGRLLVDAAVACGRERGLSRIRLHATPGAAALHRRAGFMPRTNDMELLAP